METEKTIKDSRWMHLDDELLDAVSGGNSVYADAEGIDRDSWFVSLMTKLWGERMGAPNLPPSAQENNALNDGKTGRLR